MKLLVCSVMDTKVGAYGPLFTFRSRGEAIRSFGTSVAEKDSPFGKYPGDYVMYQIGVFNDDTGVVEPALDRMIGADELGVG